MRTYTDAPELAPRDKITLLTLLSAIALELDCCRDLLARGSSHQTTTLNDQLMVAERAVDGAMIQLVPREAHPPTVAVYASPDEWDVKTPRDDERDGTAAGR